MEEKLVERSDGPYSFKGGYQPRPDRTTLNKGHQPKAQGLPDSALRPPASPSPIRAQIPKANPTPPAPPKQRPQGS